MKKLIHSDNSSMTLWYAKEYVTDTKSPKENKMNHGTKKETKDVYNLCHLHKMGRRAVVSMLWIYVKK